MFYYLNGKLAAIEPNLAIIDCGGVGFCVNTTTNTLSRLKLGEPAKVFTYCSIREDAFDIYGFAVKSELDAFQLLVGVNGVGPKAALAILSTVTPDGLSMAVATQNEKLLTAAPGVGKKIAQRILLELKDKLGVLAEPDAVSGTVMPSLPGTEGAMREAIQALEVLGYDHNTIQTALKGVRTEGADTQGIIKQALRAMMNQ